MRGIVIHFLQQDILNLHPVIYWGIATVWLLILVSAIISVRTLEIPVPMKVVWLLLIFIAPVIGLALYAIRCLVRSDWHILAPMFHSRKLNQILPSDKASGARHDKA